MTKTMVNYLFFLTVSVFAILMPSLASASNLNTVVGNIEESTEFLPGLLASLGYLSGVLLAATGIIKTLEHVNNPAQTPIRVPVIRFLLGGALFSLPIVIEAAAVTINGGALTTFSPQDELITDITGMWSNLTSDLSAGNLNVVLRNITRTTDNIPGLIAGVAYLLGILMVVSALYKTRDHVEDPDRSMLKDAVIRYLVAGALLSLPIIFEAMYRTISDSGLGGWGTAVALFIGGSHTLTSTETTLANIDCSGAVLAGTSIGSALCNTILKSAGIPSLLVALSYILGLIFGVWALVKLRDHVTNPSQTSLWEGVSRLLAGGAFFSLPSLSMALMFTFTPNALTGAILASDDTNTGFVEDTTGCGATNSLDEAMVCFMADTLGPMHILLNFFCFCAGLIFIMIGVSRLIKTSQDGARGPGGAGTVTTFVVGGVLISATTLVRALSDTIFGSYRTATLASLTYTGGMSAAETAATYNVIAAVLKFMIIIGLISFVRGIFIMRDVAEGSQQASVMAGMTHMIGGALAVNLGPLMNLIQQTLGITAFGVSFS